MRWHREFAKLAALFRRSKPADDLAEEIRAHLAMQEQENRESGMAPDEAHYAALRRFGNVTLAQERSREMWGWDWAETLWQDLCYGLRQLRRSPGFTAVAVITLALGIGANTAIFSLADAVFFRSFPFPHAERLAFLWQNNPRTGESEGAVSYPNYADWRAESRTFEDMAFIWFGKAYLTGSGATTFLSGPTGPERVQAALVSTNFFPVLGVNPALGRGFLPEDASKGHNDVAVISYGLWQQRFGSDPHIIGQRVKLWGEEHAIVGVLPRGFSFPKGTQIWRPRELNDFLQTKGRQYPNMAVIGRRRPGVTWRQAQAEMDTIAARLASEYPGIDGGVGIRIVPLREQLSERVRQGIVILWAAILGVLLIACLNTASLMIGRASGRQKEIAVRLSLGATWWRLVRQLITESASLAVAGAIVGFGLAAAAVSVVGKLNPDIARLDGRVIDVHVLAYTAAVTAITAVLCGLLPAWLVPRLDVNRSLKENSAAVSPATHLTRKTLIVAEVATAFVLVAGSVLLIRSLWGILHVDPGFDAAHVLAFHVYWPDQPKTSSESAARDALSVDLMARLRSLPGVASVGCASFVLFPDEMYKVAFQVEDQPAAPSNEIPLLTNAEASPDFFRAMGIPLLHGRVFSATDAAKNALPVAIISQAMAQRYWPNGDAVGKRFKFRDPNFKSPWYTTVGVVGDVRGQGLENASELMAYVPTSDDMSDDIVVRTTSDPLALSGTVRTEIRSFDKNLTIDHMNAASEMLAERESHREFTAWLLGAFAGAALVLAAVGIYGVLAYWVSQRTREIGVRMALGAEKNEVLRIVAGQGLGLAVVGVALGVAAALGLTRYLSSSLYGLRPADPLTLMGVSLLVIGVALLASYVPARRATKVDPMVALRYE